MKKREDQKTTFFFEPPTLTRKLLGKKSYVNHTETKKSAASAKKLYTQSRKPYEHHDYSCENHQASFKEQTS